MSNLLTLDAIREVATSDPDITLRRVHSDFEWSELLRYELQNIDRVTEADPSAVSAEFKLRNALLLVDQYGGPYMASINMVFGIRKSDSLIGLVQLREEGVVNAAEIGFWISKANENRGYMTAAAKAVSELALADAPMVYGNVSENNRASQRVLEKCGFREVSRYLGIVTMQAVGVQTS